MTFSRLIEPFRSGVCSRRYCGNFKDDSIHVLQTLFPSGKNRPKIRRWLKLAFNSAINEVYKSSLRSWKKIVHEYVLSNTDFLLNLMPEIEFFVKGAAFMQRLLERDCSLCRPEIAPAGERVFVAKGLYNPCVALKIEDEIVSNDAEFDDTSRIFILTGPNRGGKSVHTCAVGLAQAMMQLGMFVPAESARISPADAVFTHFTTGADDTIDKGRLGEECSRLRDIFDKVTPLSLVLLDESFSSTGAYEAAYIAAGCSPPSAGCSAGASSQPTCMSLPPASTK